MSATISQHRVKDYSMWKKEFEATKDLRSANGAYGDQIYRDDSDPNTVMVIMKWNTLTNARKFFSSPEMKASWSRGGVEGLSTIVYLNEG